MKKIIVFLLILVVIIAIFFIAINIYSPKDNEDNKTGAGDIKGNQDNEITGEVVKEDSENEKINGDVASGGGGGSGGVGSGSAGAGGSSGSGTDSITIPNQDLPSDLYTKPCGYYFWEYNICAGTCPDGQCLIDGKSCYCRIV